MRLSRALQHKGNPCGEEAHGKEPGGRKAKARVETGRGLEQRTLEEDEAKTQNGPDSPPCFNGFLQLRQSIRKPLPLIGNWYGGGNGREWR